MYTGLNRFSINDLLNENCMFFNNDMVAAISIDFAWGLKITIGSVDREGSAGCNPFIMLIKTIFSFVLKSICLCALNMYVSQMSEDSGSFVFSVFDELSKNGLWRRDSAVEEVNLCCFKISYFGR